MEAFTLHCSGVDHIEIARPSADIPSCTLERAELTQSAVMTELLSSVLDASDSVTGHAPKGLLSAFLDLVCGQQHLSAGMDTERLISALKVC